MSERPTSRQPKIEIKMKIQNISLFFAGIIVIIIGMLVVIFDYPQVQYFSQVVTGSQQIIELQDRDFYQRLQIEFSIGIAVLALGIMLVLISILLF